MSKLSKIVLTVIISVVFILVFSAIGNSGAETGSPLAWLAILILAGYIGALVAIWKKKKTEE